MQRRDFFKMFGLTFAAPAFLRAGEAPESAPESASESESKPKDENLVVIFSDTHVRPEGYQRDAFAKRLAALLAMNPLPAHLLLYGDFAYLFGKPEDYQTLREMMKPVESAGIAWDLAFGNHDRREVFFHVFPERRQEAPNVPDRYVSVVKTLHADFILLDSLVEGEVPGAIDDAQRAWLERTLAEYRKPVFVGAHHDLEETKLGELLRKTPAVAGYIHGHHHYWRHEIAANLPTLCLPSTGHWGDIGFVTLSLTENEALFRLKMLDFYKPEPKSDPDPEWLKTVEKKKGDAFAVELLKN